jgi:hypothetical protein
MEHLKTALESPWVRAALVGKALMYVGVAAYALVIVYR